MIEITTLIKRGNWFWSGRSGEEAVEVYKAELLETKKQLEVEQVTYLLPIDDKFIKELKSQVDRELSFCEFYEYYAKEQQKPNFNQWIFKTKKDLLETAEKDGMDEFNRNWQFKGDQHQRDNGKIRIRIIVEDKTSKTSSIRVSLHISNSVDLKFFPDNNYNEKEIVYSIVYKKESAEQRVNDYKTRAEELFEEYNYPLYCYEKREMEFLKKLLWIK